MATGVSNTHGRGDHDLQGGAARWQAIARLAVQSQPEVPLPVLWSSYVATIPAILGFEVATLYTIHPMREVLDLAAHVGVSDEEITRLANIHSPRSSISVLLLPDHALHTGKIYRIPAREMHLVVDLTPTRPQMRDQRGWGAGDTVIVPLISTATGKLIGMLLLCRPHPSVIGSDEQIALTMSLIEVFGDLLSTSYDRYPATQQSTVMRDQLESSMIDLLRQVDRARQGDFTVRATVSATSLGVIADLFNQLVRQMHDIFLQLRTTAQIVQEQTAAVRQRTGQVRVETGRQTTEISDVTSTISQITRSVEAAARDSQRAALAAAESRELVEEGRLAVEEAVRGMEVVRASAERSSMRVKRLGENVQEIETIIGRMAGFGQRLQTLAINAAIEAAHAGIQGRNLGALAQEIRTEAANSTDAVRQIGDRVAALQQGAADVVVAVEDGVVSVIEQSERVIAAGAILQAIDESADQIAQLSEGISAVTSKEAEKIALLDVAMQSILSLTESARAQVSAIDQAIGELVALSLPLRQPFGQLSLAQVYVAANVDGPESTLQG